MIIPVRCFTCGKVVGSAYPEYVKRKQQGEDPKAILDELIEQHTPYLDYLKK